MIMWFWDRTVTLYIRQNGYVTVEQYRGLNARLNQNNATRFHSLDQPLHSMIMKYCSVKLMSLAEDVSSHRFYTLHSDCSVEHCFLGDYNAQLAAGGNFGCHPLTRDDFVGSEIACFPTYQHTLALASVPSATKLIACTRHPPIDAWTGSS